MQNVAFAGTNFYIYVNASTDGTNPILTSIGPPNNATGVGVNALIRARFSESINPLTVNDSTVSVTSGTTIPVSISFDSGNTWVTLTPQAPLPDNATVTVTLNGIEDEAGNSLAASSTLFLTTGAADTTRPTVAWSSVLNGATDVPVNTAFDVTFSEVIDVPSLMLAQNTTFYDYTFGGYRPATFSVSADARTVTIVPNAVMAVGNTYGLFIGTGILDLAGNSLVNANFTFVTSFASDSTAPQVLGVSPPNGTADVPRNARLQVLFNEPIRPTSLNNANLILSGLPVPVTKTLSNGNRTLTLAPNGLLAPGSSYTFSIADV